MTRTLDTGGNLCCGSTVYVTETTGRCPVCGRPVTPVFVGGRKPHRQWIPGLHRTDNPSYWYDHERDGATHVDTTAR